MRLFGEELRREREARGLPIEAICEATKVSAKHLRALEAGELRQLPGGVFRKGFVRSYVRVLELDEDAWMARFDVACREDGLAEQGEPEWATFAENVKRGRGSAVRRTGLRWLGAMALVLAIGVAAWCCWRLLTHQRIVPGGLPRVSNGLRLKS